MIIGSAGSGKSTLARQIGEARKLPVYHMDREVFWLPNWVERSKDDQLRQVERIVALDAWVFEGNNSRTFHLREARADMLIWLDVALWRRALRVLRRSLSHRSEARPDMAEGCPERLRMLPGFLWFILSTASEGHRKQSDFFNRSALCKIRLTGLRATDTFLETLT
ncbi:MAG: AAA family ATPase [Marivita sp.]|uniref:AAA family ATPase n=1 Tax=Marivita sp. TaxID=2003365 RepID=UPI0025BA00AF|nr:AAA family ATPase [Marivita sp.]MCI5110056.1 AAA family ATPase [Marivita sp.]